MGKPKRYEQYDRHEAIGHFGSEADARNLCDGQWVVFPEVVLCLADVGEPPRVSHFRNGGEFCWVADKPYRVSDDEHVKFVPREVGGRHTGERAIHLFARKEGSQRYTYVGELSPARMFTMGGKDNHGEANFGLCPALPSEQWIELGGLDLGDLDDAAVDAAIDRLRHPVHVEERLCVLRQIVAYWHGPIGPEDGLPETDLSKTAEI